MCQTFYTNAIMSLKFLEYPRVKHVVINNILKIGFFRNLFITLRLGQFCVRTKFVEKDVLKATQIKKKMVLESCSVCYGTSRLFSATVRIWAIIFYLVHFVEENRSAIDVWTTDDRVKLKFKTYHSMETHTHTQNWEMSIYF